MILLPKNIYVYKYDDYMLPCLRLCESVIILL